MGRQAGHAGGLLQIGLVEIVFRQKPDHAADLAIVTVRFDVISG